METSNLKNMVVLKNLPSNLVEEAIVILKSSKKVKRLEKIEKKTQMEKSENTKRGKDYVLKEAEMLVSSYILKLEDKQKQKRNKSIKNDRSYIRLKRYAYLTSAIIVVQAILLIIK